MDMIVIAVVWALGIFLIVLGAGLNLRSVRAGHGPSRFAIWLQATVLGGASLVTASVLLLGTLRVDAWPALILLVPIVLGGIALIVGGSRKR